jgi:hypothetical protein
MSSSAIASSMASTLQTPQFSGHGRRKSTQSQSVAESTGSTIGQLPVGTGQGLLSNMIQSLEQTAGAQTPAAGGTAATGATTGVTSGGAAAAGGTSASAVQQDIQAFMHSLFQVLQQNGLASPAGTSAGPGGYAGVAAPATATTGTSGNAPSAISGGSTAQYQGSLVSSLQTLIQQLGATGSGNAATSNLSTAYNNLVQALGGSSASSAASSSTSSGASSGQSSNSSLQNFLGNLLQNVQHLGAQTLGLVGGIVNARV